MSKVMAIILNYNSTQDSKKCITFLLSQKECNLTILVVDNASSNNELKELEKFCEQKNIKIIKNKINKGYSAGNNVGLRVAHQLGYDYSMIINPDVEIRDELYIKKCIDKIKTDEKIAVLGTNIMNIENEHQNPLKEISYWKELIWPIDIIQSKICKNNPYLGDYNKSGYCDKLSGCCFIIRTNFIYKKGFFDEKVFLYCEEPILASMVASEKMHQYYLHDLTAYHMHKSSEKGNPQQRIKHFYKSRIYYLKNYSSYKGILLYILLLSKNIQRFIFTHIK